MKTISIRLLLLFAFASSPLISQEFLVENPYGEDLIISFDEDQTIEEIKPQIEMQSGIPSSDITLFYEGRHLEDKETQKDFVPRIFTLAMKNEKFEKYNSVGYARNYWAPLTAAEVGEIRFIITTLANTSLPALAFQRGKLERAGDNISHVHPLKFLYAIFSDEEMKVGIRNVKKKSIVWREFSDDTSKSLNDEANLGNIKADHLADFAKSLGIEQKWVTDPANKRDWNKLYDNLINKVKRKGDSDRYDF